jgi:hypothetical protein
MAAVIGGHGGAPAGGAYGAGAPLDTDRALSILRGSDPSFLQAWGSFVIAIGSCAYGTVACEMATAERKFFGLAALYMTSAGFTLAKTYRDRLLADLLEDVDFTAAVCSALRGTNAWAAQVVGSFLLAVGFSFHTLLTNVGDGEWTGDSGFAVTASVFAVVTTMLVAKAVRDRADAITLNTVVFADEQTKFNKILTVSSGSFGTFVLTGAGFVIAISTTIGGAFLMPSEVLIIERKGFILIATLFLVTSSFHLAKMVRDLADPVLAQNVNCPYMIMCVASFLGACVIGIGGVQVMTIPDSKKRFITNGLFFCVSSSLALAKLVRDRNEVAKLLGVAPRAIGEIFGVKI